MQVQSCRWTRYSDKFNVTDEFCGAGITEWITQTYRWALSSIKKENTVTVCFTFVCLSFAVGAVSGNGKLWTSRPLSRDFYPSARSAAKTRIRFISCEAASRFWFVTSFQLRFLMSHRDRQFTLKFFSSFFSCSLFLVSQMVNLFSIWGVSYLLPYFFICVYIWMLACMHRLSSVGEFKPRLVGVFDCNLHMSNV